MNKLLLTFLILLAANVCYFGSLIYAGFRYEQDISSNWLLAEKASTIEAKSEYIDAFLKTLNSNKFESNNAIFLKTPNNSFENNVKAIDTLRNRLDQIKQMDIKSFEYQTAIQQITAQEQGEAGQTLSVIKGCWYLENHVLLWDWIATLMVAIIVIADMVFIVFLCSYLGMSI